MMGNLKSVMIKELLFVFYDQHLYKNSLEFYLFSHMDLTLKPMVHPVSLQVS